MAAPATTQEFLDLVRKSGVVDEKRLEAHVQQLRSTNRLPTEPGKLAGLLVQDGLLTHFQAEQICQGKWKRFSLGKYRVLEKLGAGGMGSVFLCEHKLMRRRVAIKVLPTAKASDESSLQRFYREARAAAALDHPNIVHAYDIDQDEALHFLVMEYVDGANLQEIVKRGGPLEPLRAAHYIRQSALGLEHARQQGLVHRDIKPGNILVDRYGTVKVLDMGLARFFNDEEDNLTMKYDENVLGTADYLAPEQVEDSHNVDTRADVYSLGLTFYFLLTGKPPFGEGGNPAQKLIWQRTRQPRPLATIRDDVPAELVALIEKMITKEPGLRHQTPQEVADALEPWTQAPIPPPSDAEMPRLSLAATGASTTGGLEPTQVSSPARTAAAGTRKNWQVTPPPMPRPPVPSGQVPRPQTRPASPAPGQAASLPQAGSLASAQPPGPVAPHQAYTEAAPAAQPSTPLPPSPRPVPASGGQAAPRPAPAPSAPPTRPRTPVPAPAPAVEEDDVSWEKVTSDTEDLKGQNDTAPQPAVSPQPSTRRPAARPRTVPNEGRRFWVLALVIGGVVLGVALTALALGLFGGRSDPVGRPPLRVGKSQEGAFRSVGEALRNAQRGDRIVLLEREHREGLRLERLEGFSIESAPGVEVIWKAPANARPDDLILSLASIKHATIRGIRFDGENRLKRLVALMGYCPDLTIQDVKLEGFKQYGLAVTNCAGNPGHPVRLQGLKAVAGPKEKPDAPLAFNSNPKVQPAENNHIIVKDCRFEGSYQRTPLWLLKPVGKDVQFRNLTPPMP
ncbi:MAG: protein kinase [Gemmataceae bacterium]|nr:protein kinase [Gemmataceae bacterium]